MQVRDWDDTRLNAFIDAGNAERELGMRRQPQPLEPMRFEPRRYEEWQAAHAAMDWDDDGPAQDLTSMGMLVMAGCTAVGVVGLIALALVLL